MCLICSAHTERGAAYKFTKYIAFMCVYITHRHCGDAFCKYKDTGKDATDCVLAHHSSCIYIYQTHCK